jgi:hypothetical protein
MPCVAGDVSFAIWRGGLLDGLRIGCALFPRAFCAYADGDALRYA